MKNTVLSALFVFGGSILAANVHAQTTIPINPTGNVLAVGVYNDSNTSSDLIVSAQLTDNNGVVYVDGEMGNGPGTATFKHKVVYFDNGSGAEEPNWQQPGFDDSSWKTDSTGLGFPIGHGTTAEVGRYDIELLTSDETVYTRSIFSVQNISTITTFTIKLAGDDAAVAWLNGVFIGLAGHEISDRGELPPNFVFDTGIASGSFGAWDGGDPFAFTGTGTASFTVAVSAGTSGIGDWELFK
jgi:hypothetical protein